MAILSYYTFIAFNFPDELFNYDIVFKYDVASSGICWYFAAAFNVITISIFNVLNPNPSRLQNIP